MSGTCKTYFQCPCCKEVFEIEAEATTNIRAFVGKDGDIIEVNRLVSVVLDNPQRIPSPCEEKTEKSKGGKKQ